MINSGQGFFWSFNRQVEQEVIIVAVKVVDVNPDKIFPFHEVSINSVSQRDGSIGRSSVLAAKIKNDIAKISARLQQRYPDGKPSVAVNIKMKLGIFALFHD